MASDATEVSHKLSKLARSAWSETRTVAPVQLQKLSYEKQSINGNQRPHSDE